MAEIITVSAAPPGWWLLTRPGGDEGPWERRPLIGLALVDDGGAPFTVGLTVPNWGDEIELAEAPGRYLHDSAFPVCECGAAQREPWDEDWCRVCCGMKDPNR
jgi:hypothetical protein